MLFNKKLNPKQIEKMRKKIAKMTPQEINTLINDMSERGGSGIFFSPETRDKVIELARKELDSR